MRIPTLLAAGAVFAAGVMLPVIAWGQPITISFDEPVCEQTTADVEASVMRSGKEIVARAYPLWGTEPGFDVALVIDHGVMRTPTGPMPVTVVVHILDDCVLNAAVMRGTSAASVVHRIHQMQGEA